MNLSVDKNAALQDVNQASCGAVAKLQIVDSDSVVCPAPHDDAGAGERKVEKENDDPQFLRPNLVAPKKSRLRPKSLFDEETEDPEIGVLFGGQNEINHDGQAQACGGDEAEYNKDDTGRHSENSYRMSCGSMSSCSSTWNHDKKKRPKRMWPHGPWKHDKEAVVKKRLLEPPPYDCCKEKDTISVDEHYSMLYVTGMFENLNFLKQPEEPPLIDEDAAVVGAAGEPAADVGAPASEAGDEFVLGLDEELDDACSEDQQSVIMMQDSEPVNPVVYEVLPGTPSPVKLDQNVNVNMPSTPAKPPKEIKAKGVKCKEGSPKAVVYKKADTDGNK